MDNSNLKLNKLKKCLSLLDEKNENGSFEEIETQEETNQENEMKEENSKENKRENPPSNNKKQNQKITENKKGDIPNQERKENFKKTLSLKLQSNGIVGLTNLGKFFFYFC